MKLNSFKIILVILSIYLNTTYAKKISKPVFSHDRGFYTESFKLSVFSENGNGTIYYTLNGSDPKHSDNVFNSASPAQILINPYSSEGRGLTPGVVVRACVIHNNDTSKVETHTYIFTGSVKYQSDVDPNIYGEFWPSESAQPAREIPDSFVVWASNDYQLYYLGVDPGVVGQEKYKNVFTDALLSIPSLSLVTDPDNLFSINQGIYNNAAWHGIEWEREGSIELIDPDDNNEFQENTGIRIRGGVSRSGYCVKHAFRLFFRKEYGDGRLNYPLFKDEGVDKFDKIDLRCSQNNSWHFNNSDADYIKDLFSREMQGAMGEVYSKSKYYHLFINGMYWGLYQTQERAEASFGASYYGGLREDYDVIKSSGPSYDQQPHTLDVTDGNIDMTRDLWLIAKDGFDKDSNYYKVLGKNTDGTVNPNYKVYVDEKNLIVYMLATYYAGDTDGPVILFDNTRRINNFFGLINRENPTGFKFFRHDAEHAFSSVNINILNVKPYIGDSLHEFNPLWLHNKLMENIDYKQKFSDLCYQFLFNDGPLTPAKNYERYDKWVDNIDLAIIGESAKWGNGKTKDKNWIPVTNNFKNGFIQERTDIFIQQLIEKGWLFNLLPPVINRDNSYNEYGYVVQNNQTFKLTNPNNNGDIYYTLNNTDPRRAGGTILDDAILYNNEEIEISETTVLTSRIKNGNEWSAVKKKVFYTEKNNEKNIVISEFNYHPVNQIIGIDTFFSGTLEFVEIKNISENDIDISGFQFNKGIKYVFPFTTVLKSNSFIVICADTSNFRKFYNFSANGQYSGNLNNSGEKLVLKNPLGDTICYVNYNKGGVWFEETNGMGFTMVYNGGDTINSINSWQSSYTLNGTPGKNDIIKPYTDSLLITEVLANSEYPFTDALEIYNPLNVEVNIGGWYLTDEKEDIYKWQIPQGTILQPNGYKVFYEGHYVNDSMLYDNSEFGNAFSLSSAGETIYLIPTDSLSVPVGLACSCTYEPTEINTSIGNYINKSGKIKKVQLDSVYFGMHNIKAKQSPVIFKTIMYHPFDGHYEFIELLNRTDSIVPLYVDEDTLVSWKIGGINFTFPEMVIVNAGESIYLVENEITSEQFRKIMNLSPEDKVFTYFGRLSNKGEALSIKKPVLIDEDTILRYKYATLEKVKYNDTIPWPVLADGLGYGLARINTEDFSNDHVNWELQDFLLPVAIAGENRITKTGATINLNGSRSFDMNNNELNYQWKILSSPQGSNVTLNNINAQKPIFTADKTGNYIFSLKVSNGEFTSLSSITSVMALDNRAPVAVVAKVITTSDTFDPVEIDGRVSYDPDFDDLSYSWVITDMPESSEAKLKNATRSVVELSPDISGRYRLELTVSDGEYSSSSGAVVNVTAENTTKIEDNYFSGNNILIYPNPVKNRLNIRFTLNTEELLTASIFDLNGRLLMHESSILNSGNQLFTINLEKQNIDGGVYFVKLSCNEFTITKQIVFIK